MKKITVQPKKSENLDDKMKTEMAKIISKGFKIVMVGYDWFMYNEIKNTNN